MRGTSSKKRKENAKKAYKYILFEGVRLTTFHVIYIRYSVRLILSSTYFDTFYLVDKNLTRAKYQKV